jgi:hypothetical protein
MSEENESNNSYVSEEEEEQPDEKEIIQPEKNYIPPKNTAIKFVTFENGKFVISEEAKKLLSQKSNDNIGIISLVGKYRTGKSFLLNRVILNRKENLGFNVAPTIRPCTKGIWIWSDPLIISNVHNQGPFPAYLIDTEGLGAYDEEINHDSKIFLIAVLISSLFIFNSVGTLDENEISNLSFVLNLSKTIKIKSVSIEDNEEDLAKYFPTLLWLLRDFSLKLEDKNGNVITEKQYLENALRELSGLTNSIEEKNRVRNLIRAYFPERDCFVMVRPTENEQDLQNLQNLPDNKFRKEFLEQSKIFRNKVMKKTKPKRLNGKLLTGAMLVEFVQSVLDSINSGAIPVIEDSWRYIMKNECIKNTKELINKFTLEINKYKDENKNKKDFLKSVKKYTKNLGDKYINEFLNNNLIDDDDSKKEFSDKLQKKIEQELVRFNKEIDKITEEKFENDLSAEANKFIENLKNTDYSKNYYQYFDDVELFKEKNANMTPDFPSKEQILFDKVMLITRKFFDIEFGKLNSKNEKKMNNMETEKNKYLEQINELNKGMNLLSSKNSNTIDKLNLELNNEKEKTKKLEEKLNETLKQNKQEKENLEKEFNSRKSDFDSKNTEFLTIKKKYEDELKAKDEQILIMKMNNDKIMSLNDQKLNYFEQEINNYKDKYNKALKDSKTKEEKLNKDIILLTEENKKLKIEKEKNENLLKEEANNNLTDIMKALQENLKAQNEENKNMLEKMFKDKESSLKNNKEVIQNMKEINEKNNELILSNNNLKNEIKSLEEQNTKLNTYKDVIDNSKGLKCKYCDKLYSYDEFKDHYQNCQKGLINNNSLNNNINFNPEKLKIKILKGKVKLDELGNPYLEYIIDVNYDTQSWRINRRFNQFSNLFKTLKNMFRGVAQLPTSANIFINFGNNNQFSSFHENKIIQLEKFLKDLSEINNINTSKPFRKFLEFEQYVDEDNEMIVNMGSNNIRGNFVDEKLNENNGDKSIEDSL